LHFKNHPLIFPIKDEYNNIVGIIGRTIFTEDKRKQLNIDKYKYTFFTKTHILFGLNEAKQAISQYKSVILVEGQIDCIQLQSKGFYNVVALGGLDLHPYQFYLLKKYGGSDLRINILLDEDAAGQNAIAKISIK
jgi:DNA primase